MTNIINMTKEQIIKIVQPRKMNKLKEWSISSRILKNIINEAIMGRISTGYKFNSVYDSRYDMFRIWNVKTQNVICTVKPLVYDSTNNTRRTIIRYRHNSVYAPTMAMFNGLEIKKDKKIVIAIPSTKLGIHRGNSQYALSGIVADGESLLNKRIIIFEDKLSNKLNNYTIQESGTLYTYSTTNSSNDDDNDWYSSLYNNLERIERERRERIERQQHNNNVR